MKERKKSGRILRSTGVYMISFCAFIIAWNLYIKIEHVPSYLLPAPRQVIKSLSELMEKGVLWRHFVITGLEVVVGFFSGTLAGVILGCFLAKSIILKIAFMPYLVFFQTAPKVSLVPLYIIWFGLGMKSRIALVISMVLFPVLSGTISGLSSVPETVKNLMKILKASGWQIFWKVEVFYALPSFMAGAKIGIIQAVVGAIVSEWMSGKQGLGYLLIYASSVYDTPMLFAGIAATIVMGVCVFGAVDLLENKVLYWHESKKSGLCGNSYANGKE